MSNENKATQKPTAQMVLLDFDHSGREEMNLAGFPFALLQAASKNGQAVIRSEWDRKLPSGKIVTASWQVGGDTVLGLPGPSEELVYLVMLQLTREAAGDGPWPQKVFFKRQEFLERLGWSGNAREYKLLSDAFKRLQAVTIQAEHSFYDARSKSPFASVNFGIVDETAIVDETRGLKKLGAAPLSWFKWSDTMHASFTAGNVRSLALDFFVSLEHPTARRLFRFLEMMRHAQNPPRREFTIGVLKLRDRLGMTQYQYASKVKEKLAGGHKELVDRGYLAGVDYVKSKMGGEMVIYRFGEVSVVTAAQSKQALETEKSGAKTFETGAKAAKTPNLAPFAAVGPSIFPIEAHEVFMALPDAEKERLRLMARAEIEPAFWDRLEKPDSPMALVLWEIVAAEFPERYAAQISDDFEPAQQSGTKTQKTP